MILIFREKESYPAEKKDIDDKFNDTLKDCKRHAFVTDLVYQRVQDNVGVKAKDQSAVLEPIMPTNYYIGYQSIEANRYEVSVCFTVFVQVLKFKIHSRNFKA